MSLQRNDQDRDPVTPELLSWTTPRTPHNRAASWDDLMTEAERRYHEAKRQRLAGKEAA